MCHSYLQLPADNSKLNMTHTIHSVHFGPPFPGQVNPLDGEHIAMESTALLDLHAAHTCQRCKVDSASPHTCRQDLGLLQGTPEV